MVSLPDKPGTVALIDPDKGNLMDLVNRKFVRSVPNWDGSFSSDGRFGLCAPSCGGMTMIDLRTGNMKQGE